MAARLKEFYQQKVVPALKQELGYDNVMQIPRLLKIVVNMGLGEAVQNAKILETGVNELTQIIGQKQISREFDALAEETDRSFHHRLHRSCATASS